VEEVILEVVVEEVVVEDVKILNNINECFYSFIETFFVYMDWNWIKYKFSQEHRIYTHKIYIDLGFHKLWKDWFSVRKQVDGKPRLVFYKGDMGDDNWCEYYMDIIATYRDFKNKWFAIHVEPLGYKYKWMSHVYQYCPEIVIVFNKKIVYTIRLEPPKEVNDFSWWSNIINLITQKKD